ncbi:MAG TPA: CU044_5270 family protein [Solirubrobacterales bacterium]|nr:CU044_5270 family protein [Solirubrobacterales bacterium]
MKSQSDKLITELRSLDPVRLRGLEQTHCDSAAENLLHRILLTDYESASAPSADGRLRRGLHKKRMFAASVAAAIAALALVIGLPGGVSGSRDAMAALDEAAEAASATPPPARAGERPYLYLKTQFVSVDTTVANGKAWSVYRSEAREEWAADNGSGHRRVVEDPPKFAGPEDRASWEAAGEPNFLPADGGGTTESSLPAGTFDSGFPGEALSKLPTEPTALSEALRRRAEATHSDVPVSARTLELIGEVLRNPAASAELRAALYEAAAMIPGIEYLGEEVDVTGRAGVAVGLVSAYSGQRTLYSLIYDPHSSEALAMEATALEGAAFADTKAPFVISATVYLASERTNACPECFN